MTRFLQAAARLTPLIFTFTPGPVNLIKGDPVDFTVHVKALKDFANHPLVLTLTVQGRGSAAFAQPRDILYNLHEGGFTRLRFIQAALKAIDRGQYGECIRCGEEINQKRLEAVPWATLCIQCHSGRAAAPSVRGWRTAISCIGTGYVEQGNVTPVSLLPSR